MPTTDLDLSAKEITDLASPWLDAFTLGAPLNFLDHHLRCGNSLIGAAFKGLEDLAEKYPLGAWDTQPLLRAIQHVLFVSKLADATAAEVHSSMARYASGRRLLSGYQTMLNLVTVQYFGLPKAFHIVAQGAGLDLADRERFLASLHSDQERQWVLEAEAVGRRPDLRFFHWEIEFPEVFFGFSDASGRQIKHKDRIAAGSAGFDVIIGNPPYVRQETIKALKGYLKTTYQTYDSTNDLYVYFHEVEVLNLRAGGRMGMIVANKWMRSGYVARLRDFLQRTGQPLEVIDFGHSPIFPDADTFPCILIVTRRLRPLAEKEGPADAEALAACEVPREHWHDRMNLGVFVASRRHHVPTRLLRREGWSLENPGIQRLLEKIRTTGLPLNAYARAKPLRGILTGLNEAFIVDASTRNRLIATSRKSHEVIRPLLRGRDADRWRSRDSNTFLITIASSENTDWPWSNAGKKAEEVFQKTYPAIYGHFLPFKKALMERQDQGRYYWELRSCVYLSEFDKPKIVYQDLAWFSEFSVDDRARVPNNTVYVLPSGSSELLAVLNSPLIWWYMERTAQHGKDEVLRLFTEYVENLPIPQLADKLKGRLSDGVQQAIDVADEVQTFIAEVIETASARFALPEPDARVTSWLPLLTDAFLARLLKLAGVKQATPKLREEISVFQQTHRKRQVELLTRQLALEKKLAGLVEDAYGLTPEERSLLRSTRPVRDPLDVLEGRIRGSWEAEGSSGGGPTTATPTA